jgi:hypothetical protein
VTQAAALAVEPEWGHKILVWDTGKYIRVPKYVFPILRQLGLLINNKAILSPLITLYLEDRKLDPVVHALRMVLGPDLSGPRQVKCNCPECSESTNLDDTRVSDLHISQIVGELQERRRAIPMPNLYGRPGE